MSYEQYRPADLLRDHARSRHAPAPTDDEIDARLTEIVQPATYAVVEQYHRLGLRERVLTLPVMVSVLIALIWRQVPGVRPLARLLSRESLLWTPPLRVSQQALNQRLRTLPPSLLADVVQRIVPELAQRARTRTRPRSPVITLVQGAFPQIWAVDATTLEALFKKVGLLQGIPQTVLGGKLLGVLDVATKLPVHLTWDENPAVNERGLLDTLRPQFPPGVLLLLDRGFFGFSFFDWCTEHGIAFIMPDRPTTAVRRTTTLQSVGPLRDELLALGRYRSNPCRHPVRRITLQGEDRQYRYLTNVCEPQRLAAPDVVALYRQRWRIEEAFLLTKRLLGLSYLWTGAANGIALQIWTTWLLYAILVDLSDAVADELGVPVDRISLEMVYRGLYFYVGAASRGQTDDPVAYLAHPDQRDLGILKRPRPPTALDKALRALT
jgi:DDE family transposase